MLSEPEIDDCNNLGPVDLPVPRHISPASCPFLEVFEPWQTPRCRKRTLKVPVTQVTDGGKELVPGTKNLYHPLCRNAKNVSTSLECLPPVVVREARKGRRRSLAPKKKRNISLMTIRMAGSLRA